MLIIKKNGRKWVVQGGSGWIVNRNFPTKWKAEIAAEIFKNGGKLSDYWKKAKAKQPKKIIPQKALKIIEALYEKIVELRPTPDEITSYGKENEGIYGLVTVGDKRGYFPPKIHNSWGEKLGGRAHIDVGNDGYHIMLTQLSGQDFIDFIKRIRTQQDLTNRKNRQEDKRIGKGSGRDF